MTNHYEQMTAGTVEHAHTPLMEANPGIPEKMSVGEALNKVMGIYTQVMSMGNNDSEKEAFEKIMTGLQEGSYGNPYDAVQEAEKTMDQKLQR